MYALLSLAGLSCIAALLVDLTAYKIFYSSTGLPVIFLCTLVFLISSVFMRLALFADWQTLFTEILMRHVKTRVNFLFLGILIFICPRQRVKPLLHRASLGKALISNSFLFKFFDHTLINGVYYDLVRRATQTDLLLLDSDSQNCLRAKPSFVETGFAQESFIHSSFTGAYLTFFLFDSCGIPTKTRPLTVLATYGSNDYKNYTVNRVFSGSIYGRSG